MKTTHDSMGMPVTVEVIDHPSSSSIEAVFAYFTYIDNTFSTYKETSEISRINRGELSPEEYSADMMTVLELAEKTKEETNGYFDIRTPNGSLDPSGLVKGWAIRNAAALLVSLGHTHFCVEAGGDIQTSGKNALGEEWSVGIENPFDRSQIVKVVYPRGRGVATSGNYIRGAHIYNPHSSLPAGDGIVSFTVIGPDIYEADRFATAAFAMGTRGIEFIEELPGFEGYMIDTHGLATMTSGFDTYTS